MDFSIKNRTLYGDTKLWCRPYDMFLDEINKNGQKYRFELQDIKKCKGLGKNMELIDILEENKL